MKLKVPPRQLIRGRQRILLRKSRQPHSLNYSLIICGSQILLHTKIDVTLSFFLDYNFFWNIWYRKIQKYTKHKDKPFNPKYNKDNNPSTSSLQIVLSFAINNKIFWKPRKGKDETICDCRYLNNDSNESLPCSNTICRDATWSHRNEGNLEYVKTHLDEIGNQCNKRRQRIR